MARAASEQTRIAYNRREDGISVRTYTVCHPDDNPFQPGQSRRARWTDADHSRPPLLPYRNNLTALSHTRNLYFTAYAHQIWVCQPLFPAQTMRRTPALTIDLPVSKRGLRGYINSNYPHAVNHLVIDFLGDDEVLAVVCDDGDVIAYRTAAIHYAIEQREQGALEPNMRVLFHENVGASAWGLAVHREARMLAVSSNRHEATVFAFALVQHPDGEDDVDRMDTDSSSDEDDLTDFPNPRSKSHRITLPGISANIPHVAFCNTADDPGGRWLLGTDVAGNSIIWDIHNRKLDHSFMTGIKEHDDYEIHPDTPYHQNYAGWGIMFLDPRAARKTDDIYRAIGTQWRSPDPLDKFGGCPRAWDLTFTLRQVEDRAMYYVYKNNERADYVWGPVEPDSEDSSEPDGSDDENAEDDDGMIIDNGTSHDWDAVYDDDDDDDDGGSTDWAEVYDMLGANTSVGDRDDSRQEGDVESADEANNEPDDIDHDTARRASSRRLVPSTATRDSTFRSSESAQRLGDSTNTSRLYNPFSAHIRRAQARDRYPFLETNPPPFKDARSINPDFPPVPIVFTSRSHVILLQPGLVQRPLITLPGILTQEYMNSRYLFNFQRLNIQACIPELGILLIANQTGRVAVLALTQIPGPHCPGWKDGGIPKTVYSYRVEHVLPFGSQESEGARPPFPLVGMAVGPVQGTEGIRCAWRRWRVILAYMDESRLVFELEWRNGGHGLGVVAV